MDALCFGNLVVDLRRREDEVGRRGEPLRIVEAPLELRIGGISILAAALKRIGLEVGLMGAVGRDLMGYGLKEYLTREVGVDTQGIREVESPTSSSFIRLGAGQRYVEHAIGASAELLPGDGDVAFVREQHPRLFAIGYAGLLPLLDANGGAGMAQWIESIQANDVLVALDTHTVPPYAMLARPLGVADVFICNGEEGEGITGIPVGSPEATVSALWTRFPQARPSRPRLLGLALSDGAQLAYGAGSDFDKEWVDNPRFGSFSPHDLTGAGDCFRAGAYAYLVKHADKWHEGKLDLIRLGRWGHLVATQCLERGEIRPPDLSQLEAA